MILRESISIAPSNVYKAAMVAGCLAGLLLTGCASAPPPAAAPEAKLIKPNAPPVPGYCETVLDDGTRVTASTPDGKITVEAGPGLLRTLEWDGATRFVVMQPRKERVYGSKGIFYNGHPANWQAHNGLSRVKYEEGQRRFDNLDDAKIWMQIRRLRYVHTKDGLVIGWRRHPGKHTLQVEVWQFYIDGKKPALFPDARDYLIQVQQAPLRTGSR